MYSVDGVLVKTLDRGVYSAGTYEKTHDLSDLPNGMYFIRFQSGNMVETSKIIILK